MNWGDVRAWLLGRLVRQPDAEAYRVLQAMANGWTLRSHRYLDGRKEHRLRSLSGRERAIAHAVVEQLVARGLIQSNQKFPVATYLLTERGRDMLEARNSSSPRDRQGDRQSPGREE